MAMALLSPVIAIGLTLAVGFVIFALIGIDPLKGLYVYFIVTAQVISWHRDF